jgi:hypothetical protein
VRAEETRDEGAVPWEQALADALSLQEQQTAEAAREEELEALVGEAKREEEKVVEQHRLRYYLVGLGAAFLITALALGLALHPAFLWVGLGFPVGVAWSLFIRPTQTAREAREKTEALRQEHQALSASRAATRERLESHLREWESPTVGDLRQQVQEAYERRLALTTRASQAETAWKTHVAAVRDLEERMKRIRTKVESLRGERFPSVEEMEQVATRRERLSRERDDAATELQGVIGDRREAVEERLSQIALDRRAVEETLRRPEMAEATLSPEEMARLTGELERKLARQEELARSITQAETVISQAAHDREDLLAVQETREELTRRLQHLRARVRVLETTAEVLRAAREETLDSAGALLEETIGEYLSTLTHGRYERVVVDRDNLEPWAYSAEKGGQADTETELSLATREQLYLAARLALVKLLWPDEPPPLLLDDPLVNFDAARHMLALELLAQFGERGQVLLFTCEEAGHESAEHLLKLP